MTTTSTPTMNPAAAGITTWSIDPQHSEVGFEVSHMMFAKVRGRFEEVEGTVVLGPEGAIEESSVEATMKTASISTGQAQRDEHLRSGDFFDVERFPVLTFRSDSVERTGDGDLVVNGALKIRDMSREIQLAVTETTVGAMTGLLGRSWQSAIQRLQQERNQTKKPKPNQE